MVIILQNKKDMLLINNFYLLLFFHVEMIDKKFIFDTLLTPFGIE